MKRNVLIEITRGFDMDEQTLSKSDSKLVETAINELVKTTRKGEWPKKLYRTHGVIFPQGILSKYSTLYMYKVTTSHIVILTLDEDPLFNQRIIKLMRIAKREESTEIFNNVANLIYSNGN